MFHMPAHLDTRHPAGQVPIAPQLPLPLPESPLMPAPFMLAGDPEIDRYMERLRSMSEPAPRHCPIPAR